MSCKDGVTAGIIYTVVTSELPEYGSWRIVLTRDLQAFHAEWGMPDRLFSWEVESCEAAQAIKAFFVQEKGMTGGIDNENATLVCLFPGAKASARPRPRAKTSPRVREQRHDPR